MYELSKVICSLVLAAIMVYMACLPEEKLIGKKAMIKSPKLVRRLYIILAVLCVVAAIGSFISGI